MARVGDTLYFVADGDGVGKELHRAPGTVSLAELVVDIWSGAEDEPLHHRQQPEGGGECELGQHGWLQHLQHQRR